MSRLDAAEGMKYHAQTGPGLYGKFCWAATLAIIIPATLCALVATGWMYPLSALPGVAIAAAAFFLPQTVGAKLDWRLWLAGIAAVALLVRVACVLALPYVPSADFAVYHEAGRLMARAWTLGVVADEGARSYRCFFPPGQIFSLGILYRLFNESVLAAQLLNAVYGALTVVAVWHLCASLFGRRVARVASILAALMPSAVFGCVVIGAEVPSTFWLTAAVGFYLSARKGNRKAAAVLCGVCLGVAALIRPTIVLLPAVFAGAMLIGAADRRKAAWCAFIVLLGGAAVVLPWTLRNHQVTGGFILVSSNGGGNLYSANNDEAKGAYTASAWQYVFDSSPDDLTLQKTGFDMATDWIARNPVRFCVLAVKKFSLFWGTDKDMAWWATVQPSLDNTRLDVPNWIGQLTQGASCGHYVVCLLAAAAGLWRLRRRLLADGQWTLFALLLLYFTGLHMVFEAQGKYHFVLMPLMCLLAGLLTADRGRSDARMKGA